MALLPVKTRQTYLNALGFDCGAVDNKWGAKCKAATLRLQKKYFSRAKDRDGKYGNNTDILLRSAYNCRGLKYFALDEFKCRCGKCTGYPAVVSRTLALKMDQIVRPKYGPTTISSGLRCAYKNAAVGGAKNSLHLYGRAADWYNSATRKGYSARKTIIAEMRKHFRYAYGNTTQMGIAIHTDASS